MSRLINIKPTKTSAVFLGLIPFVLLVCLYVWGSQVRKAENPSDKLLPGVVQMATAVNRLAFTPSKRTGEYLFWVDTRSSLIRLLKSVAVAVITGLIAGLLMGAIPLVGAGLNAIVTAISLIPPLALLPILFIAFGLGELSKVMLIVIGITPVIIRDLASRVREIPSELIVKAQTLGANTAQILNRIILPQILPRLIDSVRLSLGSAWLFLIAAEAIAATDGLGYRIFLVRRYLSMDVILPYVVWIALLAFFLDFTLKLLSRGLYPWYHKQA
jgi:NitT/TauT family transport system permease protein